MRVLIALGVGFIIGASVWLIGRLVVARRTQPQPSTRHADYFVPEILTAICTIAAIIIVYLQH